MRLIVLLLCWLWSAVVHSTPLHLDLNVHLDPAAGQLVVEAQIVPPAGVQRLRLHRSLYLEGHSAQRVSGAWAHYAIEGPTTWRYRGALPGIEADQVVLYGGSGWYPRADTSMLYTMTLSVDVPPGWQAVSQGQNIAKQWHAHQPHHALYLVAAPFSVYRRQVGAIEAQAWLLAPDDALAARYLDVTGPYIDLYSALIGPYPYSKFALVENRVQTGFGMPSFTLLGSRVLRLPFIVHTSYPHEILHNWWGNSVYIDDREGNWSEGLTAYLADHALGERRGEGRAWRQRQLEHYRNAVHHDLQPLSAFRARHDAASQAIGYGKAALLFHMLRRQLGDATFIEALRTLYAQQQFQFTRWRDIAAVFSAVAGDDLWPFIRHWIHTPGAPSLALRDVVIEGTHVRGRVVQTSATPWPLYVPVHVEHAGGPTVQWLHLNRAEQAFAFELSSPVTAVQLDAQFDVFRHLAAGESPPTLGRILAAPQGTVLVPTSLDTPTQAVLASWLRDRPGWTLRSAATLSPPLPQPTLVVGWSNPHLATVMAALPEVRPQQFRGKSVSALAVASETLGFIAASEAEALASVLRRVSHYATASYLALDEAGQPQSGRWPVSSGGHALRIERQSEPPMAWPEPVLLDILH